MSTRTSSAGGLLSSIPSNELLSADRLQTLFTAECQAAADDRRSPLGVIRVENADRSSEVAELILRLSGPDDLVGRDGEHAFLLLCAPTTDSYALATRIAEAVSARQIHSSLSLASYPRDAGSPERLLAKLRRKCEQGSANDLLHEEMVAADPTMRRLVESIDRVASTDLIILIVGESGVGKDVLARRVHSRSSRASRPLVRVNCGALSATLMESELFGYEKGAFTGAAQVKPGLIEHAKGGTMILDEIGDLPPELQIKFLQVLEDGTVRRVGGLEERPVNVRYVATTNCDLDRAMKEGRFRQDLYFRLEGLLVSVPPLRDRPADIEPLARAAVRRAARALGVDPPMLADATVDCLNEYRWPGNVRELNNMLKRAVVLCTGDTMKPEDLPLARMRFSTPPSRETVAVASVPGPAAAEPPLVAERPASEQGSGDSSRQVLLKALESEERDRIIAVMDSCAGNQSRAAEMLGISRGTLLTRLDKHGIPRPRKPRTPSGSEEAIRPNQGELRIGANPRCEITVDDLPPAMTPIVVRLEAGQHQVRLRNPEHGIDGTYAIEVPAGATIKKIFTFTPRS